MRHPCHPHECFTDFALEEYVQGRLDVSVRLALEAHTAGCTECGRAVELLKAESALLRHADFSAPQREVRSTPDVQVLAAYLDGAMTRDAAEELEALLADDPILLNALLQLGREVEAASNEQEPGTPSAVPEGQLLRMPVRRRAMPAVIMPAGLKFGDGRPA